MSQAPESVADRFNRISDVYDETREPLSEVALDRVAGILSEDGIRKILEAGIGTGRIAKPLQARGFDIVGVDFSKGMLARARRKGLEDLVMGDANHLPFEDKVFDAALLAHVLHLLEDPVETFGKLSRAAKKEVVILVRKRNASDEGEASSWGDQAVAIRQALKEAAREVGYAMPERVGDWRGRFEKEVEFLESYPPSELITIQDADVATTMGERLGFFEKRAYGNMDAIPDDVFKKVIERVKARVDPAQEIRYRRVEQMAIWRFTG